MGLHGRDGLALTDHWADGPTTFLGVQTARFPNLYFPGGPHAAAGNNPRYNGDQVDFVTDLLVHRSEEHTSELQSLMRISYAVFCLKKKTITTIYTKQHHSQYNTYNNR